MTFQIALSLIGSSCPVHVLYVSDVQLTSWSLLTSSWFLSIYIWCTTHFIGGAGWVLIPSGWFLTIYIGCTTHFIGGSGRVFMPSGRFSLYLSDAQLILLMALVGLYWHLVDSSLFMKAWLIWHFIRLRQENMLLWWMKWTLAESNWSYARPEVAWRHACGVKSAPSE